ncbi:hypothetical protein CDV49_10210 [Haematobacter genomosp. 1]|uniref:Uncharacterized protein n=1 Tax=Haematobacter genomosp. 1 TaxID=366618 RepID=A0A212AB76_9RHOB|nr:hypothetical protein CDV49_10210 [Haematobacter genomosp. 1]
MSQNDMDIRTFLGLLAIKLARMSSPTPSVTQALLVAICLFGSINRLAVLRLAGIGLTLP